MKKIGYSFVKFFETRIGWFFVNGRKTENWQAYLDSKYKKTKLMQDTVIAALGPNGRMLSGSKSSYRSARPNNFVIFNANLCTKEGKLWYGDIDLTESQDLLVDLAKSLNQTVYVLHEMDGRFENESSPKLKKAPIFFTENGSVVIHPEHQRYLEISNGKIKVNNK